MHGCDNGFSGMLNVVHVFIEGAYINCGCEDDRFPLLASQVTITNPISLSSTETGANTGIRN
jgi:hypothetical protein